MYILGAGILLIINGLYKIGLLDKDHICTYDEKDIYKKMDELNSNIDDEKRAQIKDTLMSLSGLYCSFQRNFEAKGEIQKGGDFFYSRRYIELLSLKSTFRNMIDRSFLIFHFAINGFGEKMIRPLVLLAFFTLLLLFTIDPNKDFIATKATPNYLLENNSTITGASTTLIYKVVDLNTSDKLFGIRHKDPTYSVVALKLKDELKNKALFVLSKYVGFVTPANKAWYKSMTPKAHMVSLVIGALSWFLVGAFVLAIRNRIRRK